MSAAHAAPLLLYAEDELIIQQDVAAALAEAGFDVLIASDGTEALAFLESRASELRALITDGELGQGPDGWDLARRARELNATLPVLYVTGKGEREWPSKGVPHSMVIGKPFAPTQIIVAVSSLLNAGDTPG